MERASAPELSIVIPLYNEQEVFEHLVTRLIGTMESLKLVCEVLLVDDGSTDRTRPLLEALCARDTRFRGVLLSRNFGHQLAISAGLAHARGAYVAIMDGDLQDPPEALRDFYAKLQEGYDVVYAIRCKRKENIFKRAAYALFYRLLQRLSAIPIPLDSGDFCMLRRCVVDVLVGMPERNRFLRGMRCWAGFRQTGAAYERDARTEGRPKYTFRKLLSLAINGIITFSETPLRLSSVLGFTIAAGAFAYGIYLFFWRLFTQEQLPGFATLAVGMFFLGGIQLLCIGILGEYVARIHSETKGRPLYVVERVLERTSEPQVLTAPEASPAIREEPAGS